MAEIDRRTIEEYGISGVELMERAGRRVVEAMVDYCDGLEGMGVVVLCGKGNNGADGYVVARLLHLAGVGVKVFLGARKADVKGDAAEHLARLEAAGPVVEEVTDAKARVKVELALTQTDLIVDALLGTGLKEGPRQPISALIDLVNRSRRPVVAVDLPSGVNSDSGHIPGACVKAGLTVTFGLPKIGQLFYPAKEACGNLRVVDIGFPEAVIEASPAAAYLLNEEGIAALVPPRSGDAHKGRCGTVLAVAGSQGMTGAAALCAEAALRAGTGRVSLGVPAGLNDILEIKLNEVMTLPLPQVRKRRCLALRALGAIVDAAAAADCLALGPGLGTHPETAECVRRLVLKVEKPLVLDADGLNALAGHADILKKRSQTTVLTPHIGEFARLSGFKKEAILADPVARAGDFAREYDVILVLKGAPTIIAALDTAMVINPTGNAGMATAGAGDVLTGLIAGFWAQGTSGFDAACLGAFLHGRAGDLARDRLGEWGMLAGDILALVPEAILDVLQSNKRKLDSSSGMV